MKIKDGYLLRTIADTNIVVPVSERVIEFKGMITLNDVSADIWRFLETDREYDEVIDYMISEYNIDRDTASKDLKALLKHMEDSGVLCNAVN
ncbi:MAG: PqqD family protein [Lachnospiraceae bacterium]|nr:PqqD family protein [Lachnospiraceae bacterium]